MGRSCVESWQEAGVIKEGQAICSVLGRGRPLGLRIWQTLCLSGIYSIGRCRTVFLLIFFSKLVAGDEMA